MIISLLIIVAIFGAMAAIVYVLIYSIFLIGIGLFSKLTEWLIKRD